MVRSLTDGERDILNQDGPDDEGFGSRPLEHKRGVTARKAHQCDGCTYGGILPGEKYDRLVTLEDGRFTIARYCTIPGCKRADEHLADLEEAYASIEQEPSDA